MYAGSNRFAGVITGHIGGQTVPLAWGNVAFAAGVMPHDFGALTLVTLDNKPVATSVRVLLTALSRAQNTNQQWKPDNKSLASWGESPTLANAVTATVQIRTSGNRLVRALDETGTPKATLPATYKNGVLTFSVSPADRAVWYALTPAP